MRNPECTDPDCEQCELADELADEPTDWRKTPPLEWAELQRGIDEALRRPAPPCEACARESEDGVRTSGHTCPMNEAR